MYFITTKRMLEVCFSAHPNIQYRTIKKCHSYRIIISRQLWHLICQSMIKHQSILFPLNGVNSFCRK
ncbi:Uncharacterised protein [[Clostridium] symbiosum]|nr:Uncharacterised protein [[Clostridium] symbiosum]